MMKDPIEENFVGLRNGSLNIGRFTYPLRNIASIETDEVAPGFFGMILMLFAMPELLASPSLKTAKKYAVKIISFSLLILLMFAVSGAVGIVPTIIIALLIFFGSRMEREFVIRVTTNASQRHSISGGKDFVVEMFNLLAEAVSLQSKKHAVINIVDKVINDYSTHIGHLEIIKIDPAPNVYPEEMKEQLASLQNSLDELHEVTTKLPDADKIKELETAMKEFTGNVNTADKSGIKKCGKKVLDACGNIEALATTASVFSMAFASVSAILG